MNRLEKKCFIGATVAHGFLWLTVVACVAFRGAGEKPPQDNEHIIEIIAPDKMTDGRTVGGDQRGRMASIQQPPAQAPAAQSVSAPAPAPPPPPRVEQPKQQETPEPTPPPQKIVQSKPEPRHEEKRLAIKDEIPDKKTKSKPDRDFDFSDNTKTTKKASDTKSRFSFQPTKSSSSSTKTSARTNPNAKPTDSGQSDALTALAKALDRGGKTIGDRASSVTSVNVSFGPGGGGAVYANYREYVLGLYDRAWIDPHEISDDNANVETEIVIDRSGAIISSRITKRSGIPKMDSSVQAALDRVRSIGHEFPESSRDSRRTFIINFNLKARRLAG